MKIEIKDNEKMPEAIRLLNEVMKQREEILTAFYAKYGCHPDEVVQVEERTPNGTTVWYIMLKKDLNNGAY